MNALRALEALGQSVWYDYIHRELLQSGKLSRLMQEDGLCGITSNPTIYEQAFHTGTTYDEALRALLRDQPALDEQALFFALAVEDVQTAADILEPAYRASGHTDGMVSLEVSPELAHDSAGTIREALALFRRLARPNVMIKVPATRAGLEAIETLTAEGVNVNATLLFSVDRYREVAEAYLLGLEARLRRGQSVERVRSVASFFVSRVDTRVDALLEERLSRADPGQRPAIEALRGRIAIANAKIAYQNYLEIQAGRRMAALREAGAAPQRLLWASTGTKNPAYSDVLYVDELIGPETVNTMPPATYAAYKDHGRPRPTLTEDVAGARQALAALRELGIDLDAVTEELERDGVARFAESYRALLERVAEKRRAIA